MFVLHFILFLILVLCFPIAFGAMFRMILRKSDACLTGLLAASLLAFCMQQIKDNRSMLPNLTAFDGPLISGLWIAASILAGLFISYLFASLGIKLVDTIRQQEGNLETGQTLPARLKPMLCNAAVILLSLSFVYFTNAFLSVSLLHLIKDMALFSGSWVWSLVMIPEIILFCLVGFVISPAFPASRRLRWMLALAVAGSLLEWVLHSYCFPESATLWRRMSSIVPPLLPPWFVMVGYGIRSRKTNPVSRM